MSQVYNLCITGPIGVGKSTLIEKLEHYFDRTNKKYEIIPEYLGIDPVDGQNLLERKIKGEISNLTFQNYIVDMYSLKMRKTHRNGKILIYERIPEDSILCFANISNQSRRQHPEEQYLELTDFDLYILKNRFERLRQFYSLPAYSDLKTEFKLFTDPTLEEVINLIESDLSEGVTHRVIGLDIDTDECLRRIQKRNRNGEDGYSREFIDTIVKFYKNLYNQIINDKSKLSDFTFIGSLVN